MYYKLEGRVRYSEIGEKGYLSLPGILNYFQDCCTFHSESVGQGMKAVKARKRTWVLSAWQVVVNRYPGMGEEIVVGTAPYDFKGFSGSRNFFMDTKEGERLAYANSFWTNLDLTTGHPAKLTDEDIAGYELSPKLDMVYEPRKISLPEQWEEKEAFPVQKRHLDTNHHVNNCQYVLMAEDFLPEGFAIRQMRTEYKRQAVQNDMIYPEVSYGEDKVIVLLNNEEKKPYTIIEFMRQM